MFNLSTANTLPNGAEILERNVFHRIVYCYWHGAQPYVTWKVDDEGNAFWGHYFANAEDGHKGFLKRVSDAYAA